MKDCLWCGGIGYGKICENCGEVFGGKFKEFDKGLCFTIRKTELDNSNNPEEFIKNRIESICYDFTSVRSYTDDYGTEYLLFYNL